MAGTGLATQVTHGDEVTYGTAAVTLTRGFEIKEEGVEDAIERIESESLRAGKRLQSWWKPNRKGAEGDITYELANVGFGVRFKHWLGTIATTTPGGGTISKTHTATLGNLNGKSFTTQIGRSDIAGTVNPFTHVGGKVAEWDITCEVDGIVEVTETVDYMNALTPSTPAAQGGPGPALAAAAYSAGIVPLDFTGALVNVGGSPVDVTSATVHGNNQLKTDRYFLRRSALKKEPIEDTAAREITIELGGEFSDLVAYNRFVNGTEAAVTLSFQGPIIEAAIVAELLITFPRCRWDGGTPTAGGPDIIEMPQNIKVLMPASGEPVSMAYTTSDVTP